MYCHYYCCPRPRPILERYPVSSSARGSTITKCGGQLSNEDSSIDTPLRIPVIYYYDLLTILMRALLYPLGWVGFATGTSESTHLSERLLFWYIKWMCIHQSTVHTAFIWRQDTIKYARIGTVRIVAEGGGRGLDHIYHLHSTVRGCLVCLVCLVSVTTRQCPGPKLLTVTATATHPLGGSSHDRFQPARRGGGNI